MYKAYDIEKLIESLLQEEAKALRKRNIKVFSEILDTMPNLKYSTTWSEAQQMLLDNPRFTEDPDLESKWLFGAIFAFSGTLNIQTHNHICSLTFSLITR